MGTADGVYLKELYKLQRSIDRLTCGQARIDPIWDHERIFHLFITPDDGFYKGATCKFKVSVPETYPVQAPHVTCLNTVYHPNIDLEARESEICVSLLDSDWQPGVGLDGCVMAVLFLFHHPNLEDALNPLFDGKPMNKLDFMENVRDSLRGEEVEGFKFDKLIQEQDFRIKGWIEHVNNGVKIKQQNLNKKDDKSENSLTIKHCHTASDTVKIFKNTRHLILQMLQWPWFLVASLCSQIWHKMLSTFQRLYWK